MSQTSDRVPRAPSRSGFLPIILREADVNGLPPAIADAVVRVESSYDPAAIGSVGEIGLMQVRPSTAAMLGFKGTPADLADPETNIRYGVRYLAQAWRLANGDLCRTLMKYRAGHGSEKMSALSAEYCRKAWLHVASVWEDRGENSDPSAVLRSAPQAAARHRLERATSDAVRPVRPSQRNILRSSHSLIAANRAQSADAWERSSGRARSQAFWAAHETRKRVLKQRFVSISMM
ncbi:hypothetical protein AA309_13170 [Microvirga vignae]|uniref:Transglycosylase SLT domain-containing protein n=1 Tax=Microvirga vignae TaxID=1225564 RepID=A0A0H1RC43_9HYPH|nr:hypothetical protein AA309_13170 [Microvirga vignae]